MKRYNVSVIDGVYVRDMKLEHILRDPPAISYTVESLASAKAQGATTLRCNVLHTIYEISLSDFETYSFEVNRGWGKQRATRLSHWTSSIAQNSKVLKAGQVKINKARKERKTKTMIQSSFKNFGGA